MNELSPPALSTYWYRTKDDPDTWLIFLAWGGDLESVYRDLLQQYGPEFIEAMDGTGRRIGPDYDWC